MFKNYFKIAFRSLIKQKAYSIINIFGLAIGISSCLLIVLFVTDEFSYDNFQVNKDRLYKMPLERIYPNHSTNYSVIPHSFATVMPRDFPEVEQTVRINGPFNQIVVDYVKPNGELVQHEEQHMMAADSNFFSVFSFKMLEGDSLKALKNLTDVVISKSTAKRYFGDESPIGKELKIFGQPFSVSGVCEDSPENSHMKFDFLLRLDEKNIDGRPENFVSFSVHTYVLLRPNADVKALEAKLPKMVDTYASAQIERDLGKSWADYKKEGNGYRYFLQPITAIHLDPTNIEFKMKPVGGNIQQVYFLICVAVLIVVIACINFMNLATARSAERAREVGVRKTMGSAKSQLIIQFLIESVLISMIATFIAVVLAQLAMPAFNQLAHKDLLLNFSAPIITILLLFGVFVGLMAGSYPAFVLSAFNPVVVMKGNFGSTSKGSWLRNGLVVFQFAVSIVLIVGTLVVTDQMEYVRNKSLGYDKDQLLIVDRAFNLREKYQTFIDEVKKIPGVQAAAGGSAMLGNENDMFGQQFQPEGSSEILTTKSINIDDDFAQAIGFQFLEGKGYSVETSDSTSILLNETAVKTMGITGDPVGQKLIQMRRNRDGENERVVFTITGIIKDFNFQSLRDKITPLAILSDETFGGGTRYVYIRVDPKEIPTILKGVESQWKDLIGITRRQGEASEQPFKFSFLDENLKASYEADQRAGTLFSVFSTLAIVIACVGLFGLAAYTASLRTKEIGVRKVLGASVPTVILLLTKDFTKLVLYSFALAVPVSWYLMSNWLNEFAYRTSIGVGTFLIAGSLALAISLITVSYQSIRAAMRNPVKSLRSE